MGTSLVGLSILLLGIPIYKLGKEKGYMTPPALIAGETNSKYLGWLYSVVLVVFTLPYLATQPMGAGILLETLSGGDIPYFTGAFLLTCGMITYLILGGMKSSAMTDVFQGILMFTILIIFVIGFISFFIILLVLKGIKARGILKLKFPPSSKRLKNESSGIPCGI